MSFNNYKFDGGTVSNPTIFLTGLTSSSIYCSGGLTASSDIFQLSPPGDAGDNNSKVYTWETVTKRMELTNAQAIGGQYISNNITLNALSSYNANGILTQTSLGTIVGRTITGSSTIDVINGDGVAGNTILSVSPTYSVFTKVGSNSIVDGFGSHTNTSTNSVIVGGVSNNLSGNRSVILGGSSITGTKPDTVYLKNLTLSGGINHKVFSVGASSNLLSNDCSVVIGLLTTRSLSIITTLPTANDIENGHIIHFRRIDNTAGVWTIQGSSSPTSTINRNGVVGSITIAVNSGITLLFDSGVWYNIT